MCQQQEIIFDTIRFPISCRFTIVLAATTLICSKNFFTLSKERSPSMSLLYLIISAYGGCVQIKSTPSSGIKCKSQASPCLTYTNPPFSHSKAVFSRQRSSDCGFMSTPIIFRFSSFASTSVVPPPANWSSTRCRK